MSNARCASGAWFMRGLVYALNGIDDGDLSQRFVGANASAERAKNRISIDASGRLKPCLGCCESKPAAERGGWARVQKKTPRVGRFLFQSYNVIHFGMYHCLCD